MTPANTVDPPGPPADTEPSSAEGSHLDRELGELLEEIRVLLPGIQVLLAFLLTVSFTSEFRDTTGTEKAIFFTAFIAATASTVLLLIPSVWHRLRWRQHDKEALLRASNRAAVGGTLGVGTAVISVVLLVSERLYGWTAAIVTATGLGSAMALLWYAVPLRHASKGRGPSGY